MKIVDTIALILILIGAINWGLIGFLSQIGYVVAYGAAGITADYLAERFQIGVGRGAAGVIMAAGVLLSVTALLLYPARSVRALERQKR